MRTVLFALSLAVVARLGAQNPADSGVQADSNHVQSLRQEILTRYLARAHEVVGLNGDQAVRFDSTQTRAWGQRRTLMMQRQQINMALRSQLQLGGAANSDSVDKLLDARRGVTASLLRVDDQEDHELAGFLNPIQRARYLEFRQRFRERVAEAMRGGRPGMMRPGMRPGLRPGAGRRGRP